MVHESDGVQHRLLVQVKLVSCEDHLYFSVPRNREVSTLECPLCGAHTEKLKTHVIQQHSSEDYKPEWEEKVVLGGAGLTFNVLCETLQIAFSFKIVTRTSQEVETSKPFKRK